MNLFFFNWWEVSMFLSKKGFTNGKKLRTKQNTKKIATFEVFFFDLEGKIKKTISKTDPVSSRFFGPTGDYDISIYCRLFPLLDSLYQKNFFFDNLLYNFLGCLVIYSWNILSYGGIVLALIGVYSDICAFYVYIDDKDYQQAAMFIAVFVACRVISLFWLWSNFHSRNILCINATEFLPVFEVM